MTYKETGFRAVYQQLCAFPLDEKTKSIIADFPGAESANCVLVYGYIDREAGLTLEILAAGIQSKNGFRFFDTNESVKSMIRINSVEDTDFYYFADEDGELKKRYAKKIKMLDHYLPDEEVLKTREMGFLDDSRHEYCIDDVLVYLTREGLKPEGCWVRICGLSEHSILGTLLNEPDQNFDYHMGEKIAFNVQKTEDDKYICYSNMTPSMKLKASDLEDGSMLKNAIIAFNQERTQDHFLDVLELLRDSLVWIPCNAVVGEADQNALLEMLEKAGDDLDSLVGTTISNQETIRMIPDILQNGEDFFFPVFSSVEEMGEYGNSFSKVQKHFLEAIPMAEANEKNVSGIVINAFSDPFVLNRDLFDLVQNMKTRIVEE